MHRTASLLGSVVLFFGACAPTPDASAPDAEVLTEAPESVPSQHTDFTLEEVTAIRAGFDPDFGHWTGGGELSRYVYLHFSEFWPQIVLQRSGAVRPLPLVSDTGVGEQEIQVQAGAATLAGYVSEAALDGVVVVDDGQIVFETYPRMDPTDRHIWFSVSKTMVSTAVGILEDRGLVDVSSPVDAYLAPLAGTAWAGIPVIDILDMASGIDCPEVLGAADSCFWSFYEAFGWPEGDGATSDPERELAQMATAIPSGREFDYTSVNTEVLNWLVEEVSGERFSDFVEREIWQRTGAEADGFITATARGESFTAGGFNTRLRDLARYGMLFTTAGRSGPAPVISDAMVARIQEGGRPDLTPQDRREALGETLGPDVFRHATRQWDVVTRDGDFFKSGFGGQGLYVSPHQDLVVAWFGTQTEGRTNEMLSIARQLSASGRFR